MHFKQQNIHIYKLIIYLKNLYRISIEKNVNHDCQHSELLAFWTLPIARYCKEHNVSETGCVSILR
jgi:hypothetical protein